MLAQRVGDVLEDGERVEERGALEHEARAAPQRQHRLLAHALDPRAEEQHFPGVRPDESVGDAQEHGLARAAAAHDGERGALVEGDAHAAQHLVVLERLPHVPQLDDRRRHRPRHQNRKRKSFVRKKSEMITPIATCTTVAVVDRPSPSVPPSVASPL